MYPVLPFGLKHMRQYRCRAHNRERLAITRTSTRSQDIHTEVKRKLASDSAAQRIGGSAARPMTGNAGAAVDNDARRLPREIGALVGAGQLQPLVRRPAFTISMRSGLCGSESGFASTCVEVEEGAVEPHSV